MCLLKRITLYILNLSLLWLHMYVIFKSIQNAFSSSMYLLLVPDGVWGIKYRMEVHGVELTHDSCLQCKENLLECLLTKVREGTTVVPESRE